MKMISTYLQNSRNVYLELILQNVLCLCDILQKCKIDLQNCVQKYAVEILQMIKNRNMNLLSVMQMLKRKSTTKDN